MRNTYGKKAVVSTLAAGLVISSLAGVPLSDKGLLKQLGVQQAYAAESGLPSSADALKNRINQIYGEMSPAQKDAIAKSRDKALAIKNKYGTPEFDAYLYLIDPIWDNVLAKIHAQPGHATLDSYGAVNKKDLLYLFLQLPISFDVNLTDLEELRNNMAMRAVMNDLAKLGGLQDGLGEVDFTDLTQLATELEAAGKAAIGNLSDIDGLSELKEQLKTAVKTVIQTSTAKSAVVLRSAGISADELLVVRANFQSIVDADQAAQRAFATAYLSLIVKERGDIIPPANIIDLADTSVDKNSVTLQWKAPGDDGSVGTAVYYDLRYSTTLITQANFDLAIAVTDEPTPLAAGTVQSKTVSGLSDDTTYYFAIRSTDDSNNTSNISNVVEVKTDRKSSGGGGITPPPSNDKPTPTADPKVVLGDLNKELEKLNPNQQNAPDAIGAVAKAIEKIGTLNVSNSVKVEGDVAKVNIDSPALMDQFKTIGQTAQQANEQLNTLYPDAPKAKVVATLDAGNTNAKQTQFPLSIEIIDSAKANGIDAIAAQANGVGLVIDTTQLTSGSTLVLENVEFAAVVGDMRLIGGAGRNYVVGDGGAQTIYLMNTKPVQISSAFAQSTNPVQLKRPVTVGGVDTELLSLAEILPNGQIEFQGGNYDPETKKHITGFSGIGALNASSIYAVVENKVSFNDTSSVKDWAGRQIEVAAAKGILVGRADAQFVPNDKVTRAEFAKMIVKTFGLEDKNAKESFTDVNDSDWFKVYVASAVKAGIINGRSDKQFDPNAYVTRAEMATMAARALTVARQYGKVADPQAALKAFTDASDIHASLQEGVALAASQGIIIGEEGGQFNPNSDSTRAQAAVVIYRLLNK